MPVEQADIEWTNNTPLSKRFDDIYYSKEAGLDESHYVFIEQNHLQQRWQDLHNGTFVIAETGFGTGLNFLNSAKLWQEIKPNGRLHFISFEKYPLSREQLEKALSPFSILKNLSKKLIDLYPPRLEGFHSIFFEENITLQIYFGDALEGLQALDGNQFKVNAWFFDGFSPANNSDLWSEKLFHRCQPLNKQNTSFSTFTSAGHVRRKLEASGFQCKKVKGFGRKREMLVGEFLVSEEKHQQNKVYPVEQKPWFIKEGIQNNQKAARVAIIGAGLAGCWSAHFLRTRGLQCDIYEAAEKIAAKASGNPRGATYLKINETHSPEQIAQYFYVHAYLFAIRELQALFSDNGEIWSQSGLLQLAHTERLASNYKQFDTMHPLHEVAYWVNSKDASELAGINIDNDALYFPHAGHASPAEICQKLCEQAGINVKLKQNIESLAFDESKQQWSLINSGQLSFEGYDCVIIANSHAAHLFEASAQLPLHKVRGQSTQLHANKASKALKTVLCSKGYLTPAQGNSHTIGSTFDPHNKTEEILESDNDTNLDYLKYYTPDFYQRLDHDKVQSAKAGLRCQTPDMLPLAGQIVDSKTFIKDYQDIAKGQLKKPYSAAKYLPGLFVNTGHASRGLISAPYCAELLAREICQEANLCEPSITHALSPTRFFYRDLKKGKASNKPGQG